MLAVQLTLTFLLSPGLTLVAVLFLAAGSMISVRFTRRGVRSGIEMTGAMEESAGSGFRLHAGLKAALAQGTVPAFLEEYRSSLDRAASQFSRFARDYSTAQQGAAFGAAVIAAVLLLVGVRILALPSILLAPHPLCRDEPSRPNGSGQHCARRLTHSFCRGQAPAGRSNGASEQADRRRSNGTGSTRSHHLRA